MADSNFQWPNFCSIHALEYWWLFFFNFLEHSLAFCDIKLHTLPSNLDHRNFVYHIYFRSLTLIYNSLIRSLQLSVIHPSIHPSIHSFKTWDECDAHVSMLPFHQSKHHYFICCSLNSQETRVSFISDIFLLRITDNNNFVKFYFALASRFLILSIHFVFVFVFFVFVLTYERIFLWCLQFDRWQHLFCYYSSAR